MGKTIDRILANIDLLEYMKDCGYTPYPIGNGSYYGLREHGSVRIYPQTNTYFHPGTGDNRRMNVINFAQWHYGISNSEAIKMLAEELNGLPNYKAQQVKRDYTPPEKKPFELPEKRQGAYRRVYAYLTQTRCISRSVVTDMVKRGFLYEDTRGNASFVGYNDGKECFCFQRGCSDNIPAGRDRAYTHIVSGSDFEHAWSVCNGSNKLFVTEAAIDSMSVMTMFEKHSFNPGDYDYVATCGPSIKPVINYVSAHKNIDTVYLGFDNDTPGNKYRQRAREALQKEGYTGKVIDKAPHTKDFNEDLKVLSHQGNSISQNAAITQSIERMIPR